MLNNFIRAIGRIRLRYILLLAFVLRLSWYLLILFTNPSGYWLYDSNEYWNIAWNLHEYGVYSRNAEPPLWPDYFRTPLYPFFIFPTIGFDPQGYSIPLMQIVLDLVSCWLIYKILLRVTGRDTYARVGALVYALHFPAIVMTNYVLSESLLFFLLMGFTWSVLQVQQKFTLARVAIMGLWAGLAVMCKPIAFVLVFPTLLYILVWQKFNRRSLVLSLGFVLVFYAVQLPWMYRNKQVYGHYFNSVLGEHLVFGYHAAHIYGKANNMSFNDSREMMLNLYYDTLSFNPYQYPYEYAKLIEKKAYALLWQHKWLFVREHLKECTKFFIQPMRAYTSAQLGNKPYTGFLVNLGLVAQVLVQAFLYLATLYYLILVLRRKRKMQWFLGFLLLLLLVFCQFNTMPFTDARMRYPYDGWIIVAAVFSCYLVRQGHNRDNKAEV